MTASGPPFYVDPATDAWAKPNLISGLIAAPTTEKLSPLERQATIVLAWLVHHSRTFARGLLERFFAEDEEALAELRGKVEAIGARTWERFASSKG